MVRDDDAVDTFFYADFRVLGRHDAFEDHRHLDELAHFIDVIPAVTQTVVLYAVLREGRELTNARFSRSGHRYLGAGCMRCCCRLRGCVAAATASSASISGLNDDAQLTVVETALVHRGLLID